MAGKKEITSTNRYEKIIEAIFFAHYTKGATQLEFTREEIIAQAKALKIKLPKNLGDLIYSFRYRIQLPARIRACAPAGAEWIIMPAGRARYRFVASKVSTQIQPNPLLAETKVPDATPGIISMYALNDEQALLARLRYNRLIDLFTRLTCHSLQNHLRTFVAGYGQVETDELYVGVDRAGAHYIIPVQAKGGRDKLSVVQISQDVSMCANKFPGLICRPIAAQFMTEGVIALFEFQEEKAGIKIGAEKHYRLVPPEEISSDDLKQYQINREDL